MDPAVPDKEDWRIDFCYRLQGQAFQRKPYYELNDRWEHDHCAACTAKFSLRIPGALTEGYAVTDAYEYGADYEWVCGKCFDELREALSWSVVP